MIAQVDKLDKLPAGMRDSVRMEEIHGIFFLHYNIHCYLVDRHYVLWVSGCLLDMMYDLLAMITLSVGIFSIALGRMFLRH